MNNTKLVAIRISQVTKVNRTCVTLARSRRIFDSNPAIIDTRLMPTINLIGIICSKTNGSTVRRGRWLSIKRLCDDQPASTMGVDQSIFCIASSLRPSNCSKNGIIKSLGFIDIIAAKHNMAEHVLPPSLVLDFKTRQMIGCPP